MSFDIEKRFRFVSTDDINEDIDDKNYRLDEEKIKIDDGSDEPKTIKSVPEEKTEEFNDLDADKDEEEDEEEEDEEEEGE